MQSTHNQTIKVKLTALKSSLDDPSENEPTENLLIKDVNNMNDEINECGCDVIQNPNAIDNAVDNIETDILDIELEQESDVDPEIAVDIAREIEEENETDNNADNINYTNPVTETLDNNENNESISITSDRYCFAPSSPDPTDLYLREIGISPLLNKEEEVHYGRLARKGDESARKRMIESNLRLVVKIARRYLRSGMSILDLIEEGNIGLMRAVEKFDPERGFRFSTYSAWWIQQTIERAIMSQTRTIRLPVHMVKRLNGCLRTSRSLAKNLDHEPTIDEIAQAWGQPADEVEKLMALNEKVVSIDMPISEEVNKPLLDTIGDTIEDPIYYLSYDKLKKNLEGWLCNLNSKQRAVVERRFGLNGFDPMTLDQTGQEIGLTRERVRQLQAEALKLLRQEIEKQGVDLDNLLI